MKPKSTFGGGGLLAAGVPSGLQPDAAKGVSADDPWGFNPGAGSRQEELVRRSNMWRDNYNPLRSLTISSLLTILEQAERGAFAELQLLLRKSEKRFPVLKGFIEKLLSHLEGLDWAVRVKGCLPKGGTEAMAETQRAYLQERYDLLKNFRVSIAQLALADVRGYAVLQKHRFADGPNAGAVSELYWIEPWCWSRDGFYGDFYYNQNSIFGIGLGSVQVSLGEGNRLGGAELPREDFVVREAETPLYEIALIAFVNWLLGRRDYAAFVEIFGLPNAVVVMPERVPPGQEAAYLASAQQVASGVSGALPHGSDVKFPTASLRERGPFESFCLQQEKDLVLAGTGGQLTMLAPEHGGLGKGGAGEQEDAWIKIAITKATRINAALQRDFDAVELAAKFPGQPICVEFRMQAKDEEDVGKLLDNAVKCASIGLDADAGEIAAKTGLKLTRETSGAPQAADLAAAPRQDAQQAGLTTIGRAVRNRSRAMAGQGASGFYAGFAASLAPLRARVASLVSISDPALLEGEMRRLLADFDGVSQEILADPRLARVMEDLIGAGVLDGMRDKPGKAPNSGN